MSQDNENLNIIDEPIEEVESQTQAAQVPPVPRRASHSSPILFAKRTFLARPTLKRRIP